MMLLVKYGETQRESARQFCGGVPWGVSKGPVVVSGCLWVCLSWWFVRDGRDNKGSNNTRLAEGGRGRRRRRRDALQGLARVDMASIIDAFRSFFGFAFLLLVLLADRSLDLFFK